MQNTFCSQLTRRLSVRYLFLFSVIFFFVVFTYHSYSNNIFQGSLINNLIGGYGSTSAEYVQNHFLFGVFVIYTVFFCNSISDLCFGT